MDIYWFDDIVLSVDIFVAYYLNGYLLCSGVFFDENACDILEDILCEHCLQNDEVGIILCSFDDSYVVHFSVGVEVEVRYSLFRVVEQLFELFEVFSVGEDSSDCFEVEVL